MWVALSLTLSPIGERGAFTRDNPAIGGAVKPVSLKRGRMLVETHQGLLLSGRTYTYSNTTHIPQYNFYSILFKTIGKIARLLVCSLHKKKIHRGVEK